MNLLKTFSLVSFLTLLSRILGFLRDMLVANYFGATGVTDAYFVAFRLPNTLRRLFAEGAFSQAFIPNLARIKSEEGEKSALLFSRRLLSCLVIITSVFSILGMIYAEPIIRFTAQGFTHKAQIHLAAELLRIMAGYLVLISIAAFFAGMLNTWKHFLTPALTPIVFNISLIATLFLYRPQQVFTVYALAWGVMIAGVLQILIQAYPLIKKGLFPYPAWPQYDHEVRQTIKKMGPAIIGVSVAQISLLINTAVASFLPNGAITWIYFADRLMEMPTGLLGASIATILLPVLSNKTNSPQQHQDQMNWGIGLALLLSIPATCGLWSLGHGILATLFLHGSFSLQDLRETEYALWGYLFGLVPLVLTKILVTFFYARNNLKTPIKAAVIALIVTQILNISWSHTLKQGGITLAISIGAWTNTGILWIALLRRQEYRPSKRLGKIAIRSLAAAMPMSALGWLWAQLIDWTGLPVGMRVLYLGMSCTSCAILYFAILILLGIQKADFKLSA